MLRIYNDVHICTQTTGGFRGLYFLPGDDESQWQTANIFFRRGFSPTVKESVYIINTLCSLCLWNIA